MKNDIFLLQTEQMFATMYISFTKGDEFDVRIYQGETRGDLL